MKYYLPSSSAFCTSARKMSNQLTGATIDNPPLCSVASDTLFLYVREGLEALPPELPEAALLPFTLPSAIQSSLICASFTEAFHSLLLSTVLLSVLVSFCRLLEEPDLRSVVTLLLRLLLLLLLLLLLALAFTVLVLT